MADGQINVRAILDDALLLNLFDVHFDGASYTCKYYNKMVALPLRSVGCWTYGRTGQRMECALVLDAGWHSIGIRHTTDGRQLCSAIE